LWETERRPGNTVPNINRATPEMPGWAGGSWVFGRGVTTASQVSLKEGGDRGKRFREGKVICAGFMEKEANRWKKEKKQQKAPVRWRSSDKKTNGKKKGKRDFKRPSNGGVRGAVLIGGFYWLTIEKGEGIKKNGEIDTNKMQKKTHPHNMCCCQPVQEKRAPKQNPPTRLIGHWFCTKWGGKKGGGEGEGGGWHNQPHRGGTVGSPADAYVGRKSWGLAQGVP